MFEHARYQLVLTVAIAPHQAGAPTSASNSPGDMRPCQR